MRKLNKLVCSCHRLGIESGRWKGIPRQNRICCFCPGEIEDEKHMLLECTRFKDARMQFLQSKELISIFTKPKHIRNTLKFVRLVDRQAKIF